MGRAGAHRRAQRRGRASDASTTRSTRYGPVVYYCILVEGRDFSVSSPAGPRATGSSTAPAPRPPLDRVVRRGAALGDLALRELRGLVDDLHRHGASTVASDLRATVGARRPSPLRRADLVALGLRLRAAGGGPRRPWPWPSAPRQAAFCR